MCVTKVAVIYVLAVFVVGDIASGAPTGLEDRDTLPDEPGSVPYEKTTPLNTFMGIYPEKPVEERFVLRMLPSDILYTKHGGTTTSGPALRIKKMAGRWHDVLNH